MTQNEYNAWLYHTELSRYTWMIDDVTLHNTGEILAYRGGTSGQYFRIGNEGRLDIGVYTGAIPHIGEAIFRRISKGDYGNKQEAIRAAYNAGLTCIQGFIV